MDVKSGSPWWPTIDGLPAAFPPLNADVPCDVAVIGAGITSALIAERLAGAGMHVVIVDKRDAGAGSTSASTALLQFELDVEMQALARNYGEDAAALAYRTCADAIEQMDALTRDLDVDCGFRRQTSLYYASRRSHVKRLRREMELR